MYGLMNLKLLGFRSGKFGTEEKYEKIWINFKFVSEKSPTFLILIFLYFFI